MTEKMTKSLEVSKRLFIELAKATCDLEGLSTRDIAVGIVGFIVMAAAKLSETSADKGAFLIDFVRSRETYPEYVKITNDRGADRPAIQAVAMTMPAAQEWRAGVFFVNSNVGPEECRGMINEPFAVTKIFDQEYTLCLIPLKALIPHIAGLHRTEESAMLAADTIRSLIDLDMCRAIVTGEGAGGDEIAMRDDCREAIVIAAVAAVKWPDGNPYYDPWNTRPSDGMGA